MCRTQPVVAYLLAAALASGVARAQKVTPEEIVTRHLAQLSSPKSDLVPIRNVSGTCRMTTVLDAGALEGTLAMSASGDTSRLVLRFNSNVYEGESIGFDGKQVAIGFAQPRLTARSALGTFLSQNNVIVRDGLLGGVLNGRWPLLDLAAREGKVTYDGIKKLEGRTLHRLRYRARRDQGELSIALYFEPDTYRHVASVYTFSRPQAMGLTPETSSQQADQFFTLNEQFSDFGAGGDPRVPRVWEFRYSRTTNTTIEWKYHCTVAEVNAPLQ